MERALSRAGYVAASLSAKAAGATRRTGMASCSWLTPEGRASPEAQAADPDHDHAPDHQLLAETGVVERRHVSRVEQCHDRRDEERQSDEHVRRHPAHRRQALHLPAELLTLADGLRDHVEEAGQRAADLTLDRHCVDD